MKSSCYTRSIEIRIHDKGVYKEAKKGVMEVRKLHLFLLCQTKDYISDLRVGDYIVFNYLNNKCVMRILEMTDIVHERVSLAFKLGLVSFKKGSVFY